MALPQLGTSVSIVRVSTKGRKLMATHPNKTVGKLAGYLETLSKKYDVGDCRRNIIEITPIEDSDE